MEHHTFENIYINTSNPCVSSMQLSFHVDELIELHHTLVKLWTYCIARVTNTCEPGAPSWTIDFTAISPETIATVSGMFTKIGIIVHIDGADSPSGPLSTYASCVSGPAFDHRIQFSARGVAGMNCSTSFRTNVGAVFS